MTCSLSGGEVRIGVMGKGAGMIRPDVATTIVTRDDRRDRRARLLAEMLREAADASLNLVSVDGSESTNDTLVVLASGASGVTASGADADALGRALTAALLDVARQMVADGEGASRFAHYTVTGAADDDEARTAVRAIGEDILVRCALHGADPNWGRMLARAGTCGVALDAARIAVWVGAAQLVAGGVEVGALAPRPAPRWASSEVDDPHRPGRGRRARGALRVVALARIRGVQRGVHDVTRTTVVKLGGNATLDCVPIVALMARDSRICVVHGGGPQISALARERGVEPHFVGGRRVTDEPMLACVREGLAAVSAELCDALSEAGLKPIAVGAGAVDVRRVPELGLVGEPTGARVDKIRHALSGGRVPVVAPLGRDDGGTVLNVNADDAAAADRGRTRRRRARVPLRRAGRARRAGRRAPAHLRIAAAGQRDGRHAAEARGLRHGLLGGVARVSIGVAGTVVTP